MTGLVSAVVGGTVVGLLCTILLVRKKMSWQLCHNIALTNPILGDAHCLPDEKGRRGELRPERTEALTKRSLLSQGSHPRVLRIKLLTSELG